MIIKAIKKIAKIYQIDFSCIGLLVTHSKQHKKLQHYSTTIHVAYIPQRRVKVQQGQHTEASGRTCVGAAWQYTHKIIERVSYKSHISGINEG